MSEIDDQIRRRIQAIQPPRGPAPEVRWAILARTGQRRVRPLLLAPVALVVVGVLALALARPWATRPAAGDASQAEAIRSVMVGLSGPGFQPLAPGYLPDGAHLAEVRVDRQEPISRVRGVDVRFVVEGGRRIELYQRPRGEGSPAIPAESGQVRQIVIRGEPWLIYERPGAPVVVLRRDGDPAVRLEANLPVDELVRIAAELRPPPAAVKPGQ